jgi:ATP-binding cassette subfamily C (CFTR/MRP) protein 1
VLFLFFVTKDYGLIDFHSTGSGKTTLLHSLLGETHTLTGSVILDAAPDIAFCHQVPWLLNDSIRANILAGKPHIESWYAKVLDACALSRDLSTFQDGDMMLVGPQGSLLSGGQKERIVSHGLSPISSPLEDICS